MGTEEDGYVKKDTGSPPPPIREPDHSSIDTGSDDAVIIPKGSLDPVYESKAQVLNKAVSSLESAAARRKAPTDTR